MPDYTPGGGSTTATTIKRNLWDSPATPHAYDEEFEGPITFNSGSDGGWWYENNGTSGSYSTAAIDKYTAYNSGDMRVHINETHTPSWMRLQPPSDSNFHVLYRKITVPTNMLVYCRFKMSQDIGNLFNGNPMFVFALLSDDAQDRNYISPEASSGGDMLVRASRADGGSSSTIATTTDVNTQGQALEYLAIHKVGDTYHYWTGTESNWIYMGNYTNAYTPSLMYFAVHTHNEDHILSFDFVRFIETDEFPF